MPRDPELASKYPLLTKLKSVKDESQTIGAFIEWCQERGVHLMTHDECGGYGSATPGVPYESAEGHPRRATTIEQVLVVYYEIDLDALEAERVAMLEAWRNGT